MDAGRLAGTSRSLQMPEFPEPAALAEVRPNWRPSAASLRRRGAQSTKASERSAGRERFLLQGGACADELCRDGAQQQSAQTNAHIATFRKWRLVMTLCGASRW